MGEMYFWRKYNIPCFYHYAGETLTLSLSCWQSCREMVKNTSVSLSQGTTHSTLWTWLTSNRLLLSSLWRKQQEEINRGTILYSGIIFLYHIFMNAGIVHLVWLYKPYLKDRKKKRQGLQHCSRVVQHWASSWLEILERVTNTNLTVT